MFTEQHCENYFKNNLSKKNRQKRFTYPSWMKTFKDPTINFNLEPPTYAKITKIIFKMKPSTSPCPFDQVSVISFKKCPILRSHLTKIIQLTWKVWTFPKAWKSDVTVLAYKKGDPNEPENFRSITPQPVLSKIFTSVIRNRPYQFVGKNEYIESNLPKGF